MLRNARGIGTPLWIRSADLPLAWRLILLAALLALTAVCWPLESFGPSVTFGMASALVGCSFIYAGPSGPLVNQRFVRAVGIDSGVLLGLLGIVLLLVTG